MFSSNQVCEISGDFNQLEIAIRFALNMYGFPNSPNDVSYQITEDGKYCLGWFCDEDKGWRRYDFDFDAHIVSEIIIQHLKKQNIEDPYEYADGSSYKGFLMKAIPSTFSDEFEGIKAPFYGIVSIEPYINYCAK